MSRVWVTGEGGDGYWMDVPDPSGVAPINVVSSAWSQQRTISMVNPMAPGSVQAPILSRPVQPVYAATVNKTKIGTADANLRLGGGVAKSFNPVAAVPKAVISGSAAPPEIPRHDGPKDAFAKLIDPIVPGKQEDFSDLVPFWDSKKGFDPIPGSLGTTVASMAPLLLLGGLGTKRGRRKARRAVSYPNRKYRQVKSRRRRRKSVMARRRSRRR